MNNEKVIILIIDHQKTYVEIFRNILSPFYEVIVSQNGQEALETAVTETPGIILLDVALPGDSPEITGFGILKRLKKADVVKNIPVIVVTELTSVKEQEKSFSLGAVDYITKPFVSSILLARLRTHVQIIRKIRAIEQAGLIDVLTNLPNRRSFEERFALEWDRAIREKSPISILFMDMDKFKSFNDQYGHTFGDLIIQTSGAIYKRTLKRATDFVSRWGGDEFIIILPNTDSTGACGIARKICRDIANTAIPSIDGTDVLITISIGIHSETPSRGDDPAIFMDKADKALYNAKKSGRNRYCLYGFDCTEDCAKDCTESYSENCAE